MSFWLMFFFILTSLILGYIFIKRLVYSFFIFQLENYQIGNLLNWYYKNKTNKKILIPLITSMLNLLLVLFFPFKYLIYLILILSLITIPFINYQQEKKRIKYTKRMRRLLIGTFILIMIIFILNYFILIHNHTLMEVIFISILVINFLVIDVVIMAHFLCLPLEKAIQNYYVNKARYKILDNHFLNVIGITGSFGKTSTKNIIKEILKLEYNLTITPESFNTPMGISLTVNNDLRNIDDYFICEMGARRIGEIKELCDIVYPKIGIITSIGPQHLESFLSMQNIINTKFALIESLPNDGLAIINYDNEYIRNYQIKNKVQTLTFGINNPDVDYYALNIHFGIDGSTFEVQYPNKKRYLFKTKLLGKHNIYNILAGIALADYLKININKVINAISKLAPIKHRLEVIKLPNYTIIDDSYNANIEGFSNALEVLKHFPNAKVIITPGLIELGKMQYDYNYKMGEKIGKVCDYVVLVGKMQTEPIYEALINMQYPLDKIFITNSYQEGMENIFNKFTNDFTVLIENDLPDNYSEGV